MKNSVQNLFILALAFLPSFSFGQIQSSKPAVPKTHLDFFISAVNTELNYGKANPSLKDFKKPAHGVQIGFSLQAGIASRLSLVPELSFIMRGGKLKANNPLTQDETTLRFYTLELPVLARLHLGRFHLNAGPSLGYNFDGTQKLDGTTTDLSFEKEAGAYKRFDAGLQAGGGLTFRIKQKRAVLDIRYCYGLTNVSYDREAYHRSLLIRLHVSK